MQDEPAKSDLNVQHDEPADAAAPQTPAPAPDTALEQDVNAVEAQLDSEPLAAPAPAPTPEPAPSPAPEPAAPVPVTTPAPVPAAPAVASAPSEPTVKKKVLLVEDDVALAAVYRSRLELEDFELYEVNNGEDALQAAKEFKPDLILLDAMMPKISGFDVLDILRHTPETANIRVIMLTALSQPKDKERAESLGVDDYLVKSQVVIGDVVERVKHFLNMK
jgi:CheY-like chemotaxis protein